MIFDGSSTTPTGDAQLNQHQKIEHIYLYNIQWLWTRADYSWKTSFMVTIYVISSVDDKINYSPMHTTPLNSLEATPYIFFGIFNPVIKTFRRPGIREDWI